MPNANLIAQYQAAKVSVSTVSVYPHTQNPGQLPPNMKAIADACQRQGVRAGERQLQPVAADLHQGSDDRAAQLDQEETSGIPLKLTPTSNEMVKGLDFSNPIFGLVLTTRGRTHKWKCRSSPARTTTQCWRRGRRAWARRLSSHPMRATNGWRGMSGRTSTGSSGRGSFVPSRRPPMSGDFDVQTTQVGDKGKITVEALNRDNAFPELPEHPRWRARAGQVNRSTCGSCNSGPGVYTGEFDALQQGTYAVGLRYGGNNSGGTLRSAWS